MTPGFRISPQWTQSGAGLLLELREHAVRALAPQAAKALRGADRAVHLDDVSASRPAVQRVDVLGHDRLDEAPPLELGEREVPRVRLRGEQRADPAPVEAPHALGIATERLDRGDLERVDLRPDPAVGERKSGMPLSVEIPAPVRTTHGCRSLEERG